MLTWESIDGRIHAVSLPCVQQLLPLLLLIALFVSGRAPATTVDENAPQVQLILYGGDSNLDIWYKIPQECGPRIAEIGSLYIGQQFTAFAFASPVRIVPDKPGKPLESANGGKCNLSCTITIVRPDKTEQTPLRDDRFTLATQPGGMYLLPTTLSGTYDPGDPIGTYRMKIALTDEITGKSATSEIAYEVKEWTWPTGDAGENDFINYYKSFDPDILHRFVFGTALTLESWKNPEDFNPAITSLLKHAYLRHAFLLDRYRVEFKNRNAVEKKRILFLLAVTGQKPMPPEALNAEEKAYEKQLGVIDTHDPYQSLDTPGDLDCLWGEFFATGNYKPVRRLIDALAYMKEAGIADGFLKRKTPPQTDKDRIDFQHGMIFKTGAWSINSNCQQNELVAEYCLYALTNEKLPPEAQATLAVILNRKWPDKVKLDISAPTPPKHK